MKQVSTEAKLTLCGQPRIHNRFEDNNFSTTIIEGNLVCAITSGLLH